MKKEINITIKAKHPPVVELDGLAHAVYVRFSKKPVAKTIERISGYPMILLDLDKDGDVVGLEGVGFDGLTISEIKEMASKANVVAPATYKWDSASFISKAHCEVA